MHTKMDQHDRILLYSPDMVPEYWAPARSDSRRFRRFTLAASVSVCRQSGMLKRYRPIPCRLINISVSGMSVALHPDMTGGVIDQMVKGVGLDIRFIQAPNQNYSCRGVIAWKNRWTLGVEFDDVPEEFQQYLFLRSLGQRVE